MRFKPSSEFIEPLVPVNLATRRNETTLAKASPRILIVRLGSHGDVLMGTPLLRALRDAYPDAWLTWIIESSERQCIDANPYLDELLVLHGEEFQPTNRIDRSVVRWRSVNWLRRELRDREFDTYISFQAEEWLDITKMVPAKIKIGFFDYFNVEPVENGQRSCAEQLFTTVLTGADHPAHRTDQYLSVLKCLNVARPADPRMDIGFTSEDELHVRMYLSQHGLEADGKYVVIAPMSTWVTRNWPEARFAAVADRLASELELTPVLIGSRRELESIKSIADQMDYTPIIAAGEFGFRQVAALIAGASLLVGGDSGPMHVAGAVGTPYIAVFGSTPVSGRAPLSGVGLSICHEVPCGPCDWPVCRNQDSPLLCLDLVTVDEVVKAAKSVTRVDNEVREPLPMPI